MRTRPRSSTRRHPRALCASICFAAALGFATPDVALADDAASAQVLFDEAMALKAKEDWAGACPKFESSYKLDPALGTLLNLANCFEKLGKIASAWARWEEAYQWATKNGDERAEYAKTQRDALAPRLPRLKIVVTGRAPSLGVERDSTKVAEAMYGVALPVDPGEHAVFVKRDDEVLKTEKVNIAEAQSAEIALDLAAIEKAAPPRKPKGVVVVGPAPAMRAAGWAIGATGLATVLAASALGTAALSKKSESEAFCVEKLCTPQGKAIVDEARVFADAAQWVGIGGLVVTAVGVTLLIVSPSNTIVTEPAAPKKNERAKSGDRGLAAAEDRSFTRGLWAVPWVAPEPGAATTSGIGLGGGLVVGGDL